MEKEKIARESTATATATATILAKPAAYPG